MWGSNQVGAEPSRRPCPLEEGIVTMAHPRGETNRQREPHRVNLMVTLAGTSLIYLHCYILVEMPDLWVWWEWAFGRQWGGYSSTNVFQW